MHPDGNIMLYIITVIYNNINYVRIQRNMLEKFMTQPFVYIVYNNGDTDYMRRLNRGFCHKHHINVVDVPQDIYTSGHIAHRVGLSLQYAIRNVIETYGRVQLMFIDSDLFPFTSIDVDPILKQYAYFGIRQQRGHVYYYTNQMGMVDLNRTPGIEDIDFTDTTIDGQKCDCGGKLYHYFEAHPEISHEGCNQICSNIVDRNTINDYAVMENDSLRHFFERDIELFGGKSFAEVYHDSFVHLRAGTNWIGHPTDIVRQRMHNIEAILDE